MDPAKCIEILCSRSQYSNIENNGNSLKNRNNSIEERIRTYQYFNTELIRLIEQKSPARYPLICSDVTNKFSYISLSINKIKDMLIERKIIDVSNHIQIIQQHEQNKLTYVAALHLDQLQEHVEGLKNVIGTINQYEYLSKKIQDIECSISEQIESIMCILQDLYDTES